MKTLEAIQKRRSIRQYDPTFKISNVAIRSASFATQTLVLAATAKGYETGVMIGFDFDKVAELIKLPKNYVISNFIVVGKGIQGAHPRGGQTPIENVLIRNKF